MNCKFLYLKNDHYISLLFLAILICFYSLFNAQYTNWDDPEHFLTNPLVLDHSLSGFLKILSTSNSVLDTYTPLPMLSFNIEHRIFGFNPFVSHFTNIVLHAFVVIALFRLGTALGLVPLASFLGALLFAVHPMHVESVAWVTCRKDGLYGLFYILTLLCYVDYVRTGKGTLYVLALIAASFSVLSKAMALSLPAVLFLVDWFLGRKFTQKGVFDKLPFLLIVVPVVLITYIQNARSSEFLFPESILVWIWSASFYIEKFFWPFNLSPLYSPPVPVLVHWPFYLKAELVFILVGLFAVRFYKCRYFMFGISFYVLSTFFLWRHDGFDPSIVADRFMYIPSAGLCLFVGWGIFNFLERCKVGWRGMVSVLIMVFFISLMAMTYNQAFIWKNSWTIWTGALNTLPRHPAALYGRLGAVIDGRLFDGFKLDFERYVARKTPVVLPSVYSRISERSAYFRFFVIRRDFLRIKPEALTGEAYNAMALAYLNIGNSSKAIMFLNEAIRKAPLLSLSYFNRATVKALSKNYADAVKDLTLAINLSEKGSAAMYYKARASVYLKIGDRRASLDDFARSFGLDPRAPAVVMMIEKSM